jgi:ADP-ribosylglycohydrolase
MLGAIIGDIVGSRFEFKNHRDKNFELFDKKCFFTDDTVMTCAVADALIYNMDIKDFLRKFAQRFPGRGYGGSFGAWVNGIIDGPYYSFGNGAAMRVSPVAWIAKDEKEVVKLARKVTEVTHDHPEGIKGAEVTAMCVFMALNGFPKSEIKKYAVKKYPEIESFDYETLKKTYQFNETCQNTVPQAIYCFLISKDFEDCLRTSVSIGGDTDTLCAISCAIAEGYYGVPEWMKKEILKYFTKNDRDLLLNPVRVFAKKCGIDNYIVL